MKRTRRLIAAAAVAAVIGIPGSAMAQGSGDCFAESMQRFHPAFMSAAQSGPGGLRDFIGWIRANSETFPWCA
jgi:hypothetical protein